jgi:hypothetical protein
VKTIRVDDRNIAIQLWDTAGIHVELLCGKKKLALLLAVIASKDLNDAHIRLGIGCLFLWQVLKCLMVIACYFWNVKGICYH